MRPEKLYLTDIFEAILAINQFCKNIRFNEFKGNDMLRSAVLQKLIVVGEAANHLPENFCAEYAEIPWVDMINFRNFAVHSYFAVNWKIVWDTVKKDLPPIEKQIERLMEDI
jgi:uncharacterized protein with HEPN domain